MKVKVYNIDWGRYRGEMPAEYVLELPGDWFEYFSDDEKVKKLNEEVEFELTMRTGIKPKFFCVKSEEDMDEN